MYRPVNQPFISLAPLSHPLQFNALLDLAKDINNDAYASAWHGPAPGGFQVAGQLSAMDVLNVAITLTAE